MGGTVRFWGSDIRRGSGRTIVKVGDCFENMAVCVERLLPVDSTGRVPVRIQDDLGVDEIPGGYSLVQSLAKSSGSRHVSRSFEPPPFVSTERIYTIQRPARFWLSPWYGPKSTVVLRLG